jgi:hypothetical protein
MASVRALSAPNVIVSWGGGGDEGKGIAEQYRAKAARIRARLKGIKRSDLRSTVLGVAETYEAWAREFEKSAGDAERQSAGMALILS